MRLTVYTDYALRVLMYLAVKEDGLATIDEIAKSYGISRPGDQAFGKLSDSKCPLLKE